MCLHHASTASKHSNITRSALPNFLYALPAISLTHTHIYYLPTGTDPSKETAVEALSMDNLCTRQVRGQDGSVSTYIEQDVGGSCING